MSTCGALFHLFELYSFYLILKTASSVAMEHPNVKNKKILEVQFLSFQKLSFYI